MVRRFIVGIALAVASPAFLLVAGCASPPDHGVVVDRRYTPAHDDTYTTWTCVSRYANGTCSINMPVTQHDWVADNWELRLRADDAQHATGWRQVSHDVYDTHPIGTHYPDLR